MDTWKDKEIIENYLMTISKTYQAFLLYYNLYHEFLVSSSYWEHQDRESAEWKVEAMNKYSTIFSWIQWLYKLAIIELHKLFDKSNPWNSEPTISLHLLINYIEQNSSNLNVEFENDFIESCRKKINKISNKLTHLKRSRDNLSHNLQKLKIEKLKFTDIDDIAEVVDDLFNNIDMALRNNSWSFSFFHEEPKRDMDLLIKDIMKLRELSFLIMNNSWKKDDTETLKEIKAVLHLDYY